MPSTSRTRGPVLRPPYLSPMSERQQLALLMQLTSQKEPPVVTPTPVEERKRKRQQRNQRGETPLHVAAIRGDHEQVKKLLDQGQDPDVADFAGWTALHEACSYGWLQVVEVLVEGGANVNAKGLEDDTPLHDASTSGNLKMVQFLVEHGAEPFVKNTKGKMPCDYAAPHIFAYLDSLKESNAKASNIARERNDTGKKGNASSSGGEPSKRPSMDGLAVDHEAKEAASPEKSTADGKDDGHNQLSSGVVSSSQDDPAPIKRPYYDDGAEAEAEDELSKKKKRKEEEKEPMAKPAPPVARSTTGPRILTGTKPPGPASKTGAIPLSKLANIEKSIVTGSKPPGPASKTGAIPLSKLANQGSSKGAGVSGKGAQAGPKSGGSGKASGITVHQGKSSGGSKGTGLQSKGERKSPVASPKPSAGGDAEADEAKAESTAPKVPPLKIVLPPANKGSEQEGEGQRGGGKGRGSNASLPYVIPCTSTDQGHGSDSSDGNSDDKRSGENGKVKLTAAQRVLRSHRTNDGKDDKERISPGSSDRSGHGSNKTPPPSSSGHDADQTSTVTSSSGRERERAERARARNAEITGAPMELHPRKRKIKASKESHSRESKNHADSSQEGTSHQANQNNNPYQLYIHIRKQVNRRQKGLFPVKPKPPKDFNKYLMNRCTYTLQSNLNPEPQIELPPSLPAQMKEEFMEQEKERNRIRVCHVVEKEKLVLAVEQEILRVHGRAERAVANQSLPFSVCTILRDEEVYNVLAPEQEEKRNAQRSRCNGRQINSWLQEVDDKWEKIKESMLRRQHTEAETLHAVQKMSWEWKLKELGLCDYKTSPNIDPAHVPQIHVSNFDLPA